MTGGLRFVELEGSYAALRTAGGSLIVRRHRGEDVAALEREYARRRLAFEGQLGVVVAAPDESRLLASIRSTIAWLDEFEPVDGLAEAGAPVVEPPGIAALRRGTMDAFGAAGAAIEFEGEVLDRLTVVGRLATEPDPARRRALFEAMAMVWRSVDGDGGRSSPYRRLLRSSAARWARDGSPIEAAATAVGIRPGTFESTVREILAAWRAVLGADRIEPWDYYHRVGASARLLVPAVPRERLRAVNDAHLASLGADPAMLRIQYDIEPRPDRPVIPFAFTISEDVAARTADGSWRAATPWVFATYAEGGLGALGELLHESGHALHYAAIRARPALFEPLTDDGGLVEGIADVVGWDVDEPAFQRRYLGREASPSACRLGRYGGVMLDACWTLFEIELQRNPDRVPNEVWAEVTEAGLGIVPHPEWSWWAVRAQLIDAPGYLANYVLSALVAAAVRARIREVRGDWLGDGGDPGWYPFVSGHLLRFGAGRQADEVLRDFLGGPLTARALLDDLLRTD